MSALAGLLTAFAIAFVINVVPAFMPPTWSVLAFFYVRFHLPLLPLTIGGALASCAGRVVLAEASRRWGALLLSERRRASVVALGRWLDERARLATAVAVLLFSLGPIPSNQIFIAAGLSGMRLRAIAVAFFVGRVVSYTVLAAGTRTAVSHVQDVFGGYWSRVGALAIQLLVIVILVIFTRLDWPKLLHLPVPTENDPAPRG